MESSAVLTIWGFTIADLTALLMLVFTFIATVANILLWVSTRKTVTILLDQVRHQVASGYSQAQHHVIGAHRDLFLGILSSPSLLKAFTTANGLNTNIWKLQKVSEFLINQVFIGYLNFATGIVSPAHFEGFKRDARDLFTYPLVRAHWEKVRHVHSDDFRHFVEAELLWEEV